MDSQDRITVPVLRAAQAADGSVRKVRAARPVVALRAVPWLMVTLDELRRLPLDGRAGFVVSLIDGRCPVEIILDMAGMPREDVLETLRTLVVQGAIELRDPSMRPRRR